MKAALAKARIETVEQLEEKLGVQWPYYAEQVGGGFTWDIIRRGGGGRVGLAYSKQDADHIVASLNKTHERTTDRD